MIRLGPVVICMSFVFSCLAAYAANDDVEAIAKRLAPVGQVTIAGEQSSATDDLANSAKPAASGEAIYNQYCTTCHNLGVAGAPKIADKAAWKTRLAKGKDKLIQNAISGFNAMPPKGTCMTCSDDDIKNAVDYMLKSNK